MKLPLLLVPVLFLCGNGTAFAGKNPPASFLELPWRYVIGGYANGTWQNSAVTGKRLSSPRTDYRVFTLAGEQGRVSAAPAAPDADVCPDIWMQKLRIEPDLERHAIGVNASWNPMPRKAAFPGPDAAVVRNFLEGRGLAKSQVKVTQWAKVDLEGGGEAVEVIAATYYADAAELMAPKAGDYSFVAVRRKVAGKIRMEVLAGEFYPRTDDQSTPNVHELAGLLDLNGDGVLEVILRSAYYEGGGVQVWELQKGKFVRVLSLECGV